MTAGELKAVLDRVIAKAEAREDDEYASDESLDKRSGCWARIVKLRNLQLYCKDVMRLWKDLKLDDED